MSREFLFRAKHIHALSQNEHFDGTWVYGYLCNENHIYSPESEGEFLIDPETVCRYTGKNDMYGSRIMEKDICIIRANGIDEEDGHFLVLWDCDNARFLLSGSSVVVDFEVINGENCEVIGNIFDNPELMEEG